MNNNSKVHIKVPCEVPCGILKRRGLKSGQRPSRHYVDYMSDLWLDGLYFDLNDPMLDDARDSGEY